MDLSSRCNLSKPSQRASRDHVGRNAMEAPYCCDATLKSASG